MPLQRCEKLCKTIVVCKFSTLLKTYKDESLSLFFQIMFARMLAKCKLLYSFLSLTKEMDIIYKKVFTLSL